MSTLEHWTWRLTIAVTLVLAAAANFATLNDRVMSLLVIIIAVAGIVYSLLQLRWLNEQKRALRDLDERVEQWREAHGDHLSDL